MENQFGLMHAWSQGDMVNRAVAILLLIMSAASWVIIILKALDLLRLKRTAAAADAFWQNEDLATGIARLGDAPGNPFRQLAIEGRDAVAHHTDHRAQLQGSLDISDWVTRALRNSIDNTTARLQSGLAVLASVGSTAPFIGLFGTVWSIYHALVGISTSGQASIDKVAGPIGEALIMTALGLAVAVPAVLGYNSLVRGNKAVLMKLNGFAHELHAFFLTGAKLRHAQAGGSTVVSLKKGA